MPVSNAAGRIVVSLLLLLAVVAAGCSGLPAEHTRVEAKDGAMRLPLAEVGDGKVHFYTYRASGKRINFFVRTDADGKVAAYFDACFTCYKHKKGYRIEGTDLVCNECSMHFPVAEPKWDNSRGCSPILLKSTVDAAALVIRAADIEKGGRLF